MRLRVSGTVLATIVVAGCNFEVPPPSHINGTELIMVKVSVELGPLYPGRSGPTFVGMEKAPIAEVLPGDRLHLEAVVVDVDGRRLGDDELDSLWVLCGWACDQQKTYGDAIFAYFFDDDCDEVDELSTDSDCVLGTGNGRFDFEVPPLGLHAFYPWSMFNGPPRTTIYGVVAWGSRSATECWNSRRDDNGEIEGCGFIHQTVTVGPTWLALTHAAENGIELLGDDLPAIPDWMLWYPANRVPLPPTISIVSDGEWLAEGVPPLPPIRLKPGAVFSISFLFDPFSQSLQRRIVPISAPDNVWELESERLRSRTLTSGAIRLYDETDGLVALGDDNFFDYRVDPEATAGTSRVFIIYSDDLGASDFLSVEIEVE